MFIKCAYCDKNIEHFIKELEELDGVAMLKDKEINDKKFKQLAIYKSRFELLAWLIKSNKINHNLKDLSKVGEYLIEFGTEMIKFAKMEG